MIYGRFTPARFFKILLMVIVGIIIFGGGFLLLWNWLMPAIFGLPQITFWQALGLLVLSKIIFSGFGHKKHNHRIKPEWREHFEKMHAQRCCGDKQNENE